LEGSENRRNEGQHIKKKRVRISKEINVVAVGANKTKKRRISKEEKINGQEEKETRRKGVMNRKRKKCAIKHLKKCCFCLKEITGSCWSSYIGKVNETSRGFRGNEENVFNMKLSREWT